ncbi:MAG TPA: hypothetical protein VKR06_25835 [Ktedonosporobacter sp.]|nr:hypothetical protein [Ktedonosporobacter sp.]
MYSSIHDFFNRLVGFLQLTAELLYWSGGETRSLSTLRPTTIAHTRLRASPLVCSTSSKRCMGVSALCLPLTSHSPSCPLPPSHPAKTSPLHPPSLAARGPSGPRAQSQMGHALWERSREIGARILRAWFHDGTRAPTCAAERARHASTNELWSQIGERVSPYLREMRDSFFLTRYLI